MKPGPIKIEPAVPATTIYWFIHIYIYLFSLYMRVKIEYAVPATTIYWFIHIYIYLFSLYMRVPKFYNTRTRALNILVNHVYYIYIYIYIYIDCGQSYMPTSNDSTTGVCGLWEGGRCESPSRSFYSSTRHIYHVGIYKYRNVKYEKYCIVSLYLWKCFATLSMIAFSFSR